MSDPLAKLKLAELDETVARCAGIWADAQAAQGDVTPGSRVAVSVTVSPRLPVAVTVTAVRPEGVWSGPCGPTRAAAPRFPSYELEVPSAQPYSQPYWLVKSPQSATYVVDDQTLIGLADTPVEQMRIQLTVAGCPIELVRPIVYRYNDRLEGEKVRPLAVVPPVAVNLPLSPDLTTNAAVFASAAARRLPVTVKANVANAEGTLRVARSGRLARRAAVAALPARRRRRPAGTVLRGDAAGRGGERDAARVRVGQRAGRSPPGCPRSPIPTSRNRWCSPRRT